MALSERRRRGERADGKGEGKEGKGRGKGAPRSAHGCAFFGESFLDEERIVSRDTK